MANCSDNSYFLKHTDSNKEQIAVPKTALITDVFDIALVGKTRLEYGEIFNENVLHLLENFACPSVDDADNSNVPDTSVAFGTLLQNPTEGQMWYNSLTNIPHFYDGTQWIPLLRQDHVAGNYGVIAHGSTLPQPTNSDGYTFDFDECSWIVTPFYYSDSITFMRCYTDDAGVVTMQYEIDNSGTLTDGLANYQIIGIKGNANAGSAPTPPTFP